MAVILVHHLDNSRSQRVLWLLEELGLPYELVLYKRDPKTMRAPPELQKIHPLGKSPVVEVDGEKLAESGAILETLVERFGPQLRPEPGTDAFRLYRFFMHYAEGSLATPLLVALLTRMVRKSPVPFFLSPIVRRIGEGLDQQYTTPELQRHFDFLEQHLASHTWFAGDPFSAADIQMSFGLEAAGSRGGLGDRPKLAAWLQRIHARDAYQRALAKGGPYAYT
jgi:glutathione S-transferase